MSALSLDAVQREPQAIQAHSHHPDCINECINECINDCINDCINMTAREPIQNASKDTVPDLSRGVAMPESFRKGGAIRARGSRAGARLKIGRATPVAASIHAAFRMAVRAVAVASLFGVVGPSAADVGTAGQPNGIGTHTSTPFRGEALYPFVVARAIREDSVVDSLALEVAAAQNPADGQFPVRITLELLDASGRLVKNPALVTIEASAGRIRLDGAKTDEAGPRGLDVDRTQPGTQVWVKNGILSFDVLAPLESQISKVRVTLLKDAQSERAEQPGSKVAATSSVVVDARGRDVPLQVEAEINFVPEMREMIAAGLIEGVVNLRRFDRLSLGTREDGFDQEIRRWERSFNSGKANVAGRASFYVKGMVRGDVLLTAAYDSDKQTRQRLLRDVNPEGLYPVFGDSSIKGFDARSGDRLYVRLDSGSDYLLYGDFQTGDGFSQTSGGGRTSSIAQRSLGAQSRSATGLRMHIDRPVPPWATDSNWAPEGLKSGTVVGNVFLTRDSLRQVADEFATQGSGPYRLSNDAVFEGSEKVELVVRDRNARSRIVSIQPLQRLVDYGFEPFSGRIILSNFVPAFDANLNPVSVRVTYEVDQGGDRFWVAGADGQLKFNGKELGFSLAEDRNPLASHRLFSVNAGMDLGKHTRFVVEVATSQGDGGFSSGSAPIGPVVGSTTTLGPRSGEAWRAEMTHDSGDLKARAFIGRSSSDFENASAPLAGGRSEASATVSQQLTPSLRVELEGLRSAKTNTQQGVLNATAPSPTVTPTSGSREAVRVELIAQASEVLTLSAGIRGIRESAGWVPDQGEVPFANPNGLTSSVGVGSGTGLSSNPTTSFGAGQALANDQKSVSVIGGLGLRLTERTTIGAQVESGVDGAPRQRLAAGVDHVVSPQTKLYGRVERQSGLGSPYSLVGSDGDTNGIGRAANTFLAGASTRILGNTDLYSEYRMRDAIAGRDLQMASGVRNEWQLDEGIRVSAAFENIKALDGSQPSTRAFSTGLDHTAHERLKGSTRFEIRHATGSNVPMFGSVGSGSGGSGVTGVTGAGGGFTTTMWQGAVAFKMDRDWTFLARNYLLFTDHKKRGDVLQNRAQIGLAFRDTDTNLVNALAKYEYKVEEDAGVAAAGLTPDLSGTLSSRAHIVSAHVDHHPSRPLWTTVRAAAKWQTDTFERGIRSSFRSQLLSGRVVYDVTEKWDLGGLLAVQFGEHGTRQHAMGLEVGYLLQQNLWLSLGYNHTGFQADSDLSGFEYTDKGVYVRLRFKFDENLFSATNRRSNPIASTIESSTPH